MPSEVGVYFTAVPLRVFLMGKISANVANCSRLGLASHPQRQVLTQDLVEPPVLQSFWSKKPTIKKTRICVSLWQIIMIDMAACKMNRNCKGFAVESPLSA